MEYFGQYYKAGIQNNIFSPKFCVIVCSIFYFKNFSSLFGNTFVFFVFESETDDEGAKIDQSTRTLVFSVLSGVGVLGVICMLFLREPT